MGVLEPPAACQPQVFLVGGQPTRRPLVENVERLSGGFIRNQAPQLLDALLDNRSGRLEPADAVVHRRGRMTGRTARAIAGPRLMLSGRPALQFQNGVGDLLAHGIAFQFLECVLGRAHKFQLRRRVVYRRVQRSAQGGDRLEGCDAEHGQRHHQARDTQRQLASDCELDSIRIGCPRNVLIGNRSAKLRGIFVATTGRTAPFSRGPVSSPPPRAPGPTRA